VCCLYSTKIEGGNDFLNGVGFFLCGDIVCGGF
jgi:hypothetical protein